MFKKLLGQSIRPGTQNELTKEMGQGAYHSLFTNCFEIWFRYLTKLQTS